MTSALRDHLAVRQGGETIPMVRSVPHRKSGALVIRVLRRTIFVRLVLLCGYRPHHPSRYYPHEKQPRALGSSTKSCIALDGDHVRWKTMAKIIRVMIQNQPTHACCKMLHMPSSMMPRPSKHKVRLCDKDRSILKCVSRVFRLRTEGLASTRNRPRNQK